MYMLRTTQYIPFYYINAFSLHKNSVRWVWLLTICYKRGDKEAENISTSPKLINDGVII